MSIARITFAVVTSVASLHLSGVVYAQADFEGIWSPIRDPDDLGAGQPKLEELKLTPAGQVELERFGTEIDPSFRCIMPGVPRGLIDPYPLEIIQQDHQIVFLYEYYHQVRRIFMDGREMPDYWPTSLAGYSTGHWEGATLVIRTVGLSPDNLMSVDLRPFSGADDTYVIERYTRTGDVLAFSAEIYDPTYYEEPYPMEGEWGLTPDGEIWEYECFPEFGYVGSLQR